MKESTYNIFESIGLEDFEEMTIRSDLMSEVVRIIRNSGVAQKQIALVLGISEPKVSALMTGKINDFSNDTLIGYLVKLGCNIEIKVSPQIAANLSQPIKQGKMRIRRMSKKTGETPVKKTRKTKSKV